MGSTLFYDSIHGALRGVDHDLPDPEAAAIGVPWFRVHMRAFVETEALRCRAFGRA